MENEERRKSIGRHLQLLRKEAGFKSAASFANEIGIKPGTYTSYEQGEAAISYERAWDIADALGCTLDELGGRVWPPGGPPDLSADERGLVDSYRRMDPPDREKLKGVADTFVVASEKDGAGALRDVERAGWDVMR